MAFNIAKYAATMPANRPRTIESVTGEILDLKREVSDSFLAIGQRLNEAKELLPHGEWLPWLEERVQFSERTAQKFMALAREYEANPQLAADLGSEKAFALLALPETERAQFLTEPQTVDGKTKPAADLTRREFEKAVRQKAARPEPKGKKITNGDRVRAMSNEELAQIIMCQYDADAADSMPCEKYNGLCFSCCLAWLKEEAQPE